MITRDENLLKIRPELNLNSENSTELEQFQNNTLRPVLKLQNQVFINLFKEHLFATKRQISIYNTKAQKTLVRETIAKNHNLRNSFVHSVIGVLTNDEFNFYVQNKKEVSKRIISMVQKRIQDQLELLY
jgi:restriction endonuclease